MAGSIGGAHAGTGMSAVSRGVLIGATGAAFAIGFGAMPYIDSRVLPSGLSALLLLCCVWVLMTVAVWLLRPDRSAWMVGALVLAALLAPAVALIRRGDLPWFSYDYDQSSVQHMWLTLSAANMVALGWISTWMLPRLLSELRDLRERFWPRKGDGHARS